MNNFDILVRKTWWITDDQLGRPGGKRIAGPFASVDEALEARVPIEAKSAPATYSVVDEG